MNWKRLRAVSLLNWRKKVSLGQVMSNGTIQLSKKMFDQ